MGKFTISLFYFCMLNIFSAQCEDNSATRQHINTAKQQLNYSFERALSYANLAYNEATEQNNRQDIAHSLYLKGYCLINMGNVDTALVIFQRGIDVAKDLKLNDLTVLYLHEIATIYYNQGEFGYGLKLYKEALDLSRKIGNVALQGLSTHFVGKYYHSVGQFEKSIDKYEEAALLCDSAHDKIELAHVYNDMGKHYESVGDFFKSLEFYLKAEGILVHNYNAIVYASNCNHLGNLYEKLGNYAKSLEYHQLALETRRTLGYKEGVAKSLKNIGEVLMKQSRYEEASERFQNSLDICEDLNYEKGIIKNKNNLGVILTANKSYEEAEKHLKDAFTKSKHIGYEKGFVRSCLFLGKLYLENHKLSFALVYLNKARKIGEKRTMNYFLKDIYHGLYRLHKKMNNQDSALYFHVLYHEIYEQVNDAEVKNRMTELQVSHEAEKRDRENELLRKENRIKKLELSQNRQFLLFSFLGSVFLVIAIGLVFYRSRQRKQLNDKLRDMNNKIVHQNRDLEQLNYDLKRANQEKDKFFNIIAHEIRNPLWWFRNLSENLSRAHQTMAPKTIEKALKSLDESAQNAFHLTDNLLNWSRAQLGRIKTNIDKVSIHELVEEQISLLRNLAELRGIRMESNIDPGMEVKADKDLLSTVLRNLSSNAIKYTPNGGKVSFSAKRTNGFVQVEVADSGIGIEEKNLSKLFKEDVQYTTLGISHEKGSGIGLLLCKEFVELNNGKIWVESVKNQGATFKFTLPV